MQLVDLGRRKRKDGKKIETEDETQFVAYGMHILVADLHISITALPMDYTKAPMSSILHVFIPAKSTLY